jgi:hypothetical protein
MKKIHRLRLFTFGALFWMMLGSSLPTSAQPGVAVSFDLFYDELSPYGNWMSHPQYGSVWSPFVDRDFQPYATDGRWVVTEFGNTWVSDYDWGWAPFHYGRWFFDDFRGWLWVPDYEWGPAWVSWRSGGDYYGWTPLGPGIGVNVIVNVPFHRWFFVPRTYLYRPRIFGFCVPRNRVVRVYNQTTIINNFYQVNNRTYVYGPPRQEVERYSRQPVPVYQANELRSNRNVRSSEQSGVARSRAETAPQRSREGFQNSPSTDRGRVYESDAPSRSSRGSSESYSGRSNTRVGEPTTSSPSRGRGSYEDDRRTYEERPSRRSEPAVSPSRSGRQTYDEPSSGSGRTYEPSTRSRERSSSPGTSDAPSRTRGDYESRSSAPKGGSSESSAPRSNSRTERSSPSRSRERVESAPAPSGRQSSPRVSEPGSSGRSSGTAAPRSRTRE